MKYYGHIAILFAGVFMAGTAMAGEGSADDVRERLSAIALPPPGNGKLAAILQLGPDRPSEPTLLVIREANETHASPHPHPQMARWRSPSELIVQSNERPVRAGSGARISRVDATGRELAELFDRQALSSPHPSPDGKSLALTRTASGKGRLEIYDFGDGANELGPPHTFDVSPIYALAWSPDATRIALGVGVLERTGKEWSRLRVLDVASGEVRQVEDGDQENGVQPLFWTPQGLFVRSATGILRCDRDKGGCETIFDPGRPHRRVVRGTPVGDNKAWVLVVDTSNDPLEMRGNELHEVDLVKGGGKRLLRLPEGIFFRDIDWSPE